MTLKCSLYVVGVKVDRKLSIQPYYPKLQIKAVEELKSIIQEKYCRSCGVDLEIEDYKYLPF